MHYSRIPLISLLASVACAGAVYAAEEWQIVNVSDQPGLTMEIPAVIGDDYKSPNKDQLIFFAVETEGEGSMDCNLEQSFYTADLTRENVLAGIATGKADAFCDENGATVKDWEEIDSDTMTVDGVQAGTCISAYTDTSDKDSGHVEAAMLVPGQTRLYALQCRVDDDDKDDAKYDFDDFWEDKIGRMQESLHIPPSER